jgi:undecaprenyl-diphosphatase
VLAWDERITRRLRIAERPGLTRLLAMALAHSGDSWVWGALLLPVAFFGSRFYALRAWVMLAAIFATALLVLAVKFSVRRQRPEGEWGQIYRKTDPHSFPSGHAARAALLATLAVGLGPAWLGALLAIWAPLVSLARVAMGVHYLIDVLAGAALGVVIGGVILWAAPMFLRFL